MGVIATNNRELNLYYNADSSIGMQTLAFVQASKKKVLAVDLSKTKVTGTQWAELADLLGIPIKDLINQNILILSNYMARTMTWKVMTIGSRCCKKIQVWSPNPYWSMATRPCR